MINRQHLEILRTVDREGSVSEAANKLNLTQPALSHSIRKLEQQLEVKIWERSGRNLRLTDAGEQLLNLAKRMLPDFEHTEEAMTQLASGMKGLLRIGMECHPCYEWLHRSIPGFIREFNGVDIDIKRQFQFDGMTALLNHEIDMLITPDPVFRPKLEFVPVFNYELVLVSAADQPLSRLRTIEPVALAEQTLYTYPVPKERLDIYSQFMLPAKLEPAVHKTLESTDIMLQMVAAGRGVTALPSWLVKQYSKSLNLRSWKLGRKGVHKSLYLGIRTNDMQTPYIKGFIKLAKRAEIPS